MEESKTLRILLIEDNRADADFIEDLLEDVEPNYFAIDVADQLSEGIALFSERPYDAILLDLGLPDSIGSETFEALSRRASYVPIIILTGLEDRALALELVRRGAQDYLVKGQFDYDRIERSIRYAIERLQAEEALKWEHSLDAALAELYEPLISPTSNFSETTLKILEQAKRVTQSRYGYVGLIDTTTKSMVVYSHTAMMTTGECAVTGDDKRLEFPCRADGQYPALWGHALNLKEPFYTNEPSAHQMSVGIPRGHIPLERFLNVPIFIGDELVATIALANASHDYAPKDVGAIKRIGDMLSLAIIRLRSDQTVKQYSDHLEDLIEERTAQLAKSEQQYRTLVETANSLIFTLDAEGTITFANDYGARFLGYTPDELVGQNVMIIVPDVDSTGRDMAPYIDDIVAHPAEHTVSLNENITKDGRRVWVNWVNKILTDEHGRHIGHLTIGNDMTEKKRVEEALKNAERLAGIGETTTMIGHDLRNPLQALQYALELEQMYFRAMPPEAQANPHGVKALKLFTSMEEQIQYMDKIVSDLQDFARPLHPKAGEAHISALVDRTLSLLTIPESIGVHVDIPSSVTATVDPHLVQRMLANLILNAVQAMPKGGELAICATTRDSVMVLTVHDTGEGVPDNMKETLFSPLTTGKAKGTGLGLAVVKRIVDAHGGTVEFDSEEGNGTTFIVTFPQAAE